MMAYFEFEIFQPKPFRWMLDIIWLNLVELSSLEPFRDLLDQVIFIIVILKLINKLRLYLKTKSGSIGVIQNFQRKRNYPVVLRKD